MKRNLVPIDEIGPVIRELVEERWPHSYGYDVLAEKIGYDASAIYGIAMVERATADFDLVDKILCALGRFDHWYGRFAHIYPTKFMETCASPSCGKQFPEKVVGPNRRLYCSPGCQSLARAIRRGIATGARRKNLCNRGHRLTKDNILMNGSKRMCRICAHDRRRDAERKEARLAYKREWVRRKRAAARAA